MRIDFNSRGAWRRGPEFDERDIELIQDAGGRLAMLSDAGARIVGESGEICFYYKEGRNWFVPGGGVTS